MSDNEVNTRIENGDLIYNTETNDWLMNHKSRTINVEMTIETYNKYQVWIKNGCPTTKESTHERNNCDIDTLNQDVKDKPLLSSNINNDSDDIDPDDNEDDNVTEGYSKLAINSSDDVNVIMSPIAKVSSDMIDNSDEKTLTDKSEDPKNLLHDDTNDFEDKTVARGGSALAINSSDDEEDEICHVSKPMKGNVIEDDDDNDEQLSDDIMEDTNNATKPNSNKQTEDTYMKNIEAHLLFFENNKEDYVWDGR